MQDLVSRGTARLGPGPTRKIQRRRSGPQRVLTTKSTVWPESKQVGRVLQAGEAPSSFAISTRDGEMVCLDEPGNSEFPSLLASQVNHGSKHSICWAATGRICANLPVNVMWKGLYPSAVLADLPILTPRLLTGSLHPSRGRYDRPRIGLRPNGFAPAEFYAVHTDFHLLVVTSISR